jgi:hypothetical protein
VKPLIAAVIGPVNRTMVLLPSGSLASRLGALMAVVLAPAPVMVRFLVITTCSV